MRCDSGYGNTMVDVEFTYTITSVNAEARTIEITFDFWGSESYEADYDDCDYDDYDGCAHDWY